MAYVMKAEIRDLEAETLVFQAQKTMYGGKLIAAGDVIYLFASENEGGPGLYARGVVASVEAVPRRPAQGRETPRMSLCVAALVRAKRRLGRKELKPFAQWQDGKPETELNFKFYRQATNKIAGISDQTAAFLDTYF